MSKREVNFGSGRSSRGSRNRQSWLESRLCEYRIELPMPLRSCCVVCLMMRWMNGICCMR